MTYRLSLSIFIFILGINLPQVSYTQTRNNNSIQPLYKGDKVPDISLGKIINYKSATARFSDFKGKLVILDFWATWCSPCLASLPRMDSLQQKFGDNIAIIPIDGLDRGESEVKAKQYFSKKKLNLPSVVEDSVLSKLFPHTGIPHEVWISPDGVVLTTTGHEEVTGSTIEQYFATGALSVKEKIDIMDFDFSKPLFVEGNGGAGNRFLYRSVLTKGIDGLRSGYQQEPSKKGNQLMIKSCKGVDIDLLNLYTNILLMGRNPASVNPTRIIIETKDSNFHPMDYRNNRSLWLDSTYCYELDLPMPIEDSTFYRKYMLDDLNRCFANYKGRIEKRMIPSLVITRIEHQKDLLAPLNDTVQTKLVYSDLERNILEKVQNMPFDNFIRFLRLYYYSSPPIFNETGLTSERVTMDLHLKYNQDKACEKTIDIEAWKIAFHKYGLEIKEELRESEVVVLSLLE